MPCVVENCERPSCARGLCSGHYQRLRKYGDVQADKPFLVGDGSQGCKVDGCEGQHYGKGYCAKHWKAFTAYGDPLINKRGVKQMCQAEGCDKLWQYPPYCTPHHRRWKKWGDPLHEYKPVRSGRWYVTSYGYHRRWQPEHPNASKDGGVFEHVVVMAEKLGRPLRKSERVHHINGVKTDNRPDNLELWVNAHPSGQRVSELIQFAHDLLEQYKDDAQLWPEGLQP